MKFWFQTVCWCISFVRASAPKFTIKFRPIPKWDSSIGLACGIRLLHIESNVQLLFDTDWLCYFSLCWKWLYKLNYILCYYNAEKEEDENWNVFLLCWVIRCSLSFGMVFILKKGMNNFEKGEQREKGRREREREVFDH